MPFAGKSALVTGGGSGMGEAVAKRLAAEGASVLVADFDEVNGQRVVAEISAAGATAVFQPTDVSDHVSAQNMVNAAVAAFGKLDLAANIAGIAQQTVALEETDPAVWQRLNAVNSSGVFYSLRAEIPALRAAGGGSVVNMSSTGGLKPLNLMHAYTASKHAVIGLTKSAALENIRAGIRINGIAPGIIRTPLLTGTLDDAQIDAYADTLPGGRIGTPDDVANVVLFLLSDEASYITGAVIPVDGGQLLA